MPEQITKYPEVTIKVLEGAGARCGPSVEKKILKQCPAERFCSFDSGEICAYGIDQIPKMTQVTLEDLAKVACPSTRLDRFALPDAAALAATFVLGFVFAMLWRRWRRR